MFGFLRRSPKLDTYSTTVSRDVLIQTGRILFVDDEDIPLLGQLQHAGLSVDHDRTGSEFEAQVINQTYDVAILDHTGVGMAYGTEQGLDLLKYLRRVSPRTRIIAFTSKALGSQQSDFFRMADTVLPKDAGKRESLERVEEELQHAFDKRHLFDALMNKLSVASISERQKMQSLLEKSLSSNNQDKFRAGLKKVAGAAAEKGVDIVLNRLFAP